MSLSESQQFHYLSASLNTHCGRYMFIKLLPTTPRTAPLHTGFMGGNTATENRRGAGLSARSKQAEEVRIRGEICHSAFASWPAVSLTLCCVG